MKKRLKVSLLLMVFAVLTACGGKNVAPTTPTITSPEELTVTGPVTTRLETEYGSFDLNTYTLNDKIKLLDAEDDLIYGQMTSTGDIISFRLQEGSPDPQKVNFDEVAQYVCEGICRSADGVQWFWWAENTLDYKDTNYAAGSYLLQVQGDERQVIDINQQLGGRRNVVSDLAVDAEGRCYVGGQLINSKNGKAEGYVIMIFDADGSLLGTIEPEETMGYLPRLATMADGSVAAAIVESASMGLERVYHTIDPENLELGTEVKTESTGYIGGGSSPVEGFDILTYDTKTGVYLLNLDTKEETVLLTWDEMGLLGGSMDVNAFVVTRDGTCLFSYYDYGKTNQYQIIVMNLSE